MTGKVSAGPHDAFFRQVMTQPDAARDFLDIHLPQDVRAMCDLSTLQLESGSFIEDDLRARYSDVLWSVQMNQQKGYLYALIEHQSKPDKQMTQRLMRYSLAAMQRHVEAGHETLPVVVPILFYHGATRPYPYSMCWFDAFSDAELAKRIYTAPFPLVDITEVPDDAILTHRRIAILEFLQKHIRQRDLMALTASLVKLLQAGYTSNSQLRTALTYILQVGFTEDKSAFFRELAEGVSQQGEIIMTLAEELRQEGLAQGLEQGIEQGLVQGLEKGREEATFKIAQAMIANGIDRLQILQLTGLSEEMLETLAR